MVRANGSRQQSAVSHQQGFTLIELMTVVFIVGILASVALPNYRSAILQTKEVTLKHDLFIFRDVIDQYYADKGKYPASLEDLSKDGYLRGIPADPITNAADWELVMAEPDPDNPTEPPGIYDVHSASTDVSSRGTPYNEW